MNTVLAPGRGMGARGARAWAAIRRWAAAAPLALYAALAVPGAQAQELVKLPPPALVTDLTGTLSAEQRKALDAKLHAFEIAHGSQIALVMLPTTQPEDIASFGNRLGEAWKLGRKDVGDGLILIVAKQDKKMRIEVARTLEGAVPDASAKRIVREQLAPAFSQGDFYGGIDRAFDALFRLVEGEGLPAPTAKSGAPASSSGGIDALIPILVGAVVVGAFLRVMLGRTGALLAGAGAGGAGWLLVGLPMLLAGGLGVVVAILVLAMGAGGRGLGPIVTGGSHGGWGGGGWGGGGGGGGWSSGGGGDFSGGGASGSWD